MTPGAGNRGRPSTRLLARALRIIDEVSIWAGKTVSWGSVVLMVTICYEVVMRYVFNSPTVWSMELGTFIFAGVWLFSGAWAHQMDVHIKVDVVYSRLSRRKKAVVDLITSPFVVIMMVVMIIQLTGYGLDAMRIHEHSSS